MIGQRIISIAPLNNSLDITAFKNPVLQVRLGEQRHHAKLIFAWATPLWLREKYFQMKIVFDQLSTLLNTDNK